MWCVRIAARQEKSRTMGKSRGRGRGRQSLSPRSKNFWAFCGKIRFEFLGEILE